ncbi:MAG: hypothetical protein ACKPKO_22250, partial [Candidatus Fonsibacter sp.]
VWQNPSCKRVGGEQVADLGRVLFKPLADYIIMVYDLTHLILCAEWQSRGGWTNRGLPAKAS